METESLNESTWTGTTNFNQTITTGQLISAENILSEEESVDIDDAEEPNQCEKDAIHTATQNGISRHDEHSNDDIGDDNDLKTAVSNKANHTSSVISVDDDAPPTIKNTVTHVENNNKSPGNDRCVYNDNNENDVEITSDNEDEIDDDDDDDDMVALEKSTTSTNSTTKMLTKVEQYPAAAFSPLSVPVVTMAAASPVSPSTKSPSVSKHDTSVSRVTSNAVSPAKFFTAAQPVSDGTPKKLNTPMSNSTSSKSLPIHCVIEQKSPGPNNCSTDNALNSHVVLDSYAILPGSTLFSDLVKASLTRLGYSTTEAVGAKGGIQLNNWNTLAFEAVTDNPDATVEEILGEVTSVATLRIQLSSQLRASSSSDDVKDKLLQLLLTKSKDFLVQAGCPIEKSLLDAITTGEINQSISEHVCTSFNDWYMKQKGNNSPLPLMSSHSTPSVQSVTSVPSLSPGSVLTSSVSAKSHTTSDMKNLMTAAPGKPSALSSPSLLFCEGKKDQLQVKREGQQCFPISESSETLLQKNKHSGSQDFINPHCNRNALNKTPDKNSLRPELCKIPRSPSEGNIPSTLQNHQSNPYLGMLPGKTRIRTSFDPEHEIPRLQKWFSENQHPTREQMMRFMHELNSLESRKGRRPLDLTNIIYWFKNARAAQRRANKALDDSFENEENVDMNASGSGNCNSDSVPPYLPNKNAVYMIPFHPYPHLIPGSGGTLGVGSNGTSSAGVDEPYDLSLTKRPSCELSKIHNGKDQGENQSISQSTSPSPTKSSPTSSECESHGDNIKKAKKSYCPPRFPALLDAASKMRQEIPPRCDDIYFGSNTNNSSITNHSGDQTSPYRSGSGSSDAEHSSKHEDTDNFSNPSTPIQNGNNGDSFSTNLKTKHEDSDYLNQQNLVARKNYRQAIHVSRDSGMEMGQVKKEDDNKMNSSDEDITNDGYDSEEELKLRIKQNAAVVDYASAMHNNVSRLTAANMAALSLAQMGQPLHIPQLTSSLAMAYYPMDPRFYSQHTVPHSLSSSPPTSLAAATHPSHLSQLSIRQSQDTATPHLDSRSPLSSPSAIQQSMKQMGHHHGHHQQQPQVHHRHHSEPRKRRTRVFIDPLTEIPKLEKWFTEDTHPSAFMIDKYCEELNKCEYRHKFPKLEPKNVQLWFKNHRAKVKRMKVSYNGQEEIDVNGDDDMDD